MTDDTQSHFGEVYDFAFHTVHPPRFARAHPLTLREAAELAHFLGDVSNLKGFRLSMNLVMGIFVEATADKFSNPMFKDVRRNLTAFVSGGYSDMDENGTGRDGALAILEKFSRPVTGAVNTVKEGKRLVAIAAALERKMREPRGRPKDAEFYNLVAQLDAVFDQVNAARGLGSHHSHVPKPRVQCAERFVSLVADCGLVVLSHRPELDAATASEARGYFESLREKGWRAIAEVFTKVRGKKKKKRLED